MYALTTNGPRCSTHRDRETASPLCSTCQRIGVEVDIVTRTVDRLLSLGYALNVNNGGDTNELERPTKDRAPILRVLGETDDDFLLVYRDRKETDKPRIRRDRLGWIRFVYGNDGWDVISDYIAHPLLESALEPIEAYADTLA